MSPKEENVEIRLEIVPPKLGDYGWGYTFTIGTETGGAANGHADPIKTIQKACRLICKEVRRVLETKDEKSKRLDERKRRVAVLRKAKDERKIP